MDNNRFIFDGDVSVLGFTVLSFDWYSVGWRIAKFNFHIIQDWWFTLKKNDISCQFKIVCIYYEVCQYYFDL